MFTKQDKAFIGQVDLVPFSPGVIEIGWIFFPEYQGMGLGTECVRNFLVVLIDELIHKGFRAKGSLIKKVIATAHPENIASNKLMEKALPPSLCGLFELSEKYKLAKMAV